MSNVQVWMPNGGPLFCSCTDVKCYLYWVVVGGGQISIGAPDARVETQLLSILLQVRAKDLLRIALAPLEANAKVKNPLDTHSVFFVEGASTPLMCPGLPYPAVTVHNRFVVLLGEGREQ